MTEHDPDFDAISATHIFEEAKDRLKASIQHESNFRQAAKAAARFREGDQWDDQAVNTTVSSGEPELTINLTDALVRRVVNNIKEQRPRGNAHPVGDGADIDKAEKMKGIGRHVENRSEASVAYDSAADQAVTMGKAFFRMFPEYVAPDSFDKDLRIQAIPNMFSVYMDPSAMLPAGQDANWVIISTKIKRTEYKRLYPSDEPDAFDFTDSRANEDWEDKEEIRLAEYFRIREKSEKLNQIKRIDGSTYTRFKSETLPPEKLAAVGDVIIATRDSMRRSVEWFKLNGTKVIDREVLPGEWIPVFRVVGNVANIDGEVFWRGMVAGMEDPQRMVNYGETAKIKRLGLAKKAQWTAYEGQLEGHPEWDNANIDAVMVLVHKPVVIETSSGSQLLPPPQALPPAAIEAGFTEFVQGMRTNLMAVAGMPSEPGADTQGTVVSGKAIQKRQGYSDQSHLQYYDNLTLAIAQCWRVMLQWIPRYFPAGRVQRVIGEDGTPEMTTLDDLSVGRYDIVMDTGPGYQTKREEGADNLLQLLSIGPLAELIAKDGADLVFRSIDHPYMQELADRLTAHNPEGLKKIMEGLPARAKSLVQSLFNQVQALQGQVSTLETDLKQGITKAHLAATVKAHDVEESNKTKRADTESRERTTIKKTAMEIEGKLRDTEIDSATKLLDTHLQAGYDDRAADKMIAQGENSESGAK